MQAVFLPARETQGLKNTFAGKPYFKQPFNNDPVDPSEDVESDVDLDVFVDVVNKTSNGLAMTATDSLAARGTDLGKFMTNVGGIVKEFSGDHKTPIMKGIVPNITYRTKTNTKGPSISGQASSLFIRNRPGRKSGTHYGTSRAPLPRTEEEDEPVFNLQDLIKKSKEPSLHQFNKQRKKIKEVMSFLR